MFKICYKEDISYQVRPVYDFISDVITLVAI